MSASSHRQDTHSRWLSHAQIALGWAIVLLLLGTVGAVYLGQASRTALIGREAQFLEEESEFIRDENAILEQRIAEAQSVSVLETRLEEAGLQFVRPRPYDLQYVDITVYVPPARELTLTRSTAPQSAETPPDRIWDALLILVEANFSGLFQGESSANR